MIDGAASDVSGLHLICHGRHLMHSGTWTWRPKEEISDDDENNRAIKVTDAFYDAKMAHFLRLYFIFYIKLSGLVNKIMENSVLLQKFSFSLQLASIEYFLTDIHPLTTQYPIKVPAIP